MSKLKLTRLQLEIFKVLCKNSGKELNQKALARETGVSSTAISKAIKILEKEDLIKVKKDSLMNLILITLNRDDKKVLQFKRAENLKQIYFSGLVEELEEKFAGATIILFGSYSRGDDTIKSDIDLAIINRKEKEINLKSFEKVLQREITLHFYSSWNEIHKELKENIFNGIVLAGGIEL